MSIGPQVDGLPGLQNAEFIDALIDNCRLSHEQVALTKELMAAQSLSFVDAALHLKFITTEQAADTLDRSQGDIAHPSVVERALRRQSVGRVATVPASVYVKSSRDLLLVHDPDHPHCERVRALRTELSLLLGEGGREASVIAVLSPGPGEGRSQLAAELAIAFSQLGRRTLLVEADLRRPHQHVLFEAANSLGMAHSLKIGRQPQFLRVEGLPQLSLLTAGPVPSNPLELLSDGRFERMLSDWRRAFDIIIIDTPAVTQFADGLAIASLAQQVVLVSRANVTSHKDMKDTLRRLTSTNARILGAVINNF
jgi:protein-tyrosine kinase